MFQIQINTKDGWSVASSVAGYKAEFLSLEEAQLKFARCANDNDIPSMYRILDLETLKVYPIVKRPPEIPAAKKCPLPGRFDAYWKLPEEEKLVYDECRKGCDGKWGHTTTHSIDATAMVAAIKLVDTKRRKLMADEAPPAFILIRSTDNPGSTEAYKKRGTSIYGIRDSDYIHDAAYLRRREAGKSTGVIMYNPNQGNRRKDSVTRGKFQKIHEIISRPGDTAACDAGIRDGIRLAIRYQGGK